MSINGAQEKDSFYYLKQLIAKGDEAAFRKVFDLFFTPLFEFARSLVKSKEAATEITDAVFIRLWNNRANITGIENLKVYLYKAVKNASLNHLSRKAHLSMQEPFDDVDVHLKDVQSPEQLLITKELLGRIRDAVEQLPTRCKMVFKLVREDGLKYKEVADILNLSVKTIDAQMVIAINRIREQLKGHLVMPSQKKPQKK